MIELANLVVRLTNSKSTIVFRPLPADDPKQRRPDVTVAKQVLDWEPSVDLEQGLKATIGYFQENSAGGGKRSRGSFDEHGSVIGLNAETVPGL